VESSRSFNLLANAKNQPNPNFIDVAMIYVLGKYKFRDKSTKIGIDFHQNHVTCPEYGTPKFIWPHQLPIYANK